MRTIAKVVERFRQMPRLTKVLTESRGLINTTDLLVATAATVILAAGVGSAAIGTLNDAKYGKAQPDGQAMGNAITQFYKDTGKWPGQAEQAPAAGSFSADPTFLVTSTTTSVLPDDKTVSSAGVVTDHGAIQVTAAAVCQNNSGQGFVGVTIGPGDLSVGSATLLDINDYLVRKPNDILYPNWQGPYLQQDIKTDPWDRAWVFNLQPLYCSETVTDTDTAQNLGYAWALSGGTNRTITTALSVAHLDASGDDSGINLGKLVKRGTGGTDAGTTTPTPTP